MVWNDNTYQLLESELQKKLLESGEWIRRLLLPVFLKNVVLDSDSVFKKQL